jgi:hypothetical protein
MNGPEYNTAWWPILWLFPQLSLRTCSGILSSLMVVCVRVCLCVCAYRPIQNSYTYLSRSLGSSKGRAIAQTVSLQLTNAAARVRTQVRTCGIYGGQSGTGGFLRVDWFPPKILIPPTATHSSSITLGWYCGQVSSALSLTPPQET